MSLQENIAAAIRAIMEQKNKSLTDFSEELGISRTALYEYLNGRGNPCVSTIDQIAQRLGISPVALTAGLLDLDHSELVLLLLNTIRSVSELAADKRLRFAELFLEMVELWDEK